MPIDDKRIFVHHVGARNGTRAFPVLSILEKDIVNVLYDADSDCLAHAKAVNKNLESELHVLPYCLGDARRRTFFNINYDPHTSSVYEANPNYGSYYCFNASHDYLFSDVARTVEKRLMDMTTIDELYQSKDAFPHAPDFLSIDTQGSEYDVLAGATNTLKSDVVAIAVEAEFHPIYKGQKLFGDLAGWLSDAGFDFARFLGTYQMSPFRSALGLRGDGFHVFCDALFFRRLHNLDGDKNTPKANLMMKKLAFIAIVFNQFEYGLECLRRSKGQTDGPCSRERPFYLKFLTELEEQIEKMSLTYPPTYAEKYPTYEKSNFIAAMPLKVSVSPVKNKLMQLMRRPPCLHPFFQWIGWPWHSIKETLDGHTSVEKVLIKYGLDSQADVLKKNRMAQTAFFRR